jgi:transposase
VTITPESLPDDIAALKRIIAEIARDAVSAQAEIAKLKFQLARFRRAEFGRSSEKLAREGEQLELAIESLETDQAERLATASPAVAAAIEETVERHKPARRPLPEHLPREEVLHPAACACPHCGANRSMVIARGLRRGCARCVATLSVGGTGAGRMR